MQRLNVQIQLVVVFSFLFLGLLWVHASNLEVEIIRLATEAAKARLALAGQALVSGLSRDARGIEEDSGWLEKLASADGLSRIVLMNDQGEILGDSTGKARKGESASVIGLPEDLPARMSEGRAFYYGPVRGEYGRAAILYLFRLPENIGGSGRLMVIALSLRPEERQRAAAISGLLLNVFGLTGLLVFLYFLSRSMLSGSREPEGGTAVEPTGLVINSFHDLIQRLKAKEQELESLRKRAEDRAEAIESYNEDVLRSVSSGVITFDLEQRVTTFNTAAERILGIDRRQAIRSSCDEVFGPENPIRSLLEVSLQKRLEMARQEFELRRRDGEPICVGVSTSLLRDREDRLRGATVVFTDLTEIKRLQEQVELRRRLTVLGEMSAGIAHEFRNYMGTVMGFAKLLSRKMDRDDPRQEMTEAIIRELGSMDRLITDLLGFGRQDELTMKPTEIEPLIRRLVLQAMAHAGNFRPEVSITVEPGLPRAAVDEILFPQAISNILQNAVEAMGGKGTLTVSIGARFRSDAGGAREIELRVTDTGVGIPPENLERIFLPFFTTKEKGTGLGLALAHKIILSHGGRIEVESREGTGTTFRIFLPAAVPNGAAAGTGGGSKRS